MKEKVKQLRVEIDGLAQLTEGLKPIKKSLGVTGSYQINSDQIKKAVDSLYLGKAWLGKVLGALGTESPYPKDGSRKDIKDIEPTADKNEDIHGYNLDVVHFEDKSHIEKVDWLRQEIGKIADKDLHLDMGHGGQRTFYLWSMKHLSEARFWLGFELERIRNAEDN